MLIWIRRRETSKSGWIRALGSALGHVHLNWWMLEHKWWSNICRQTVIKYVLCQKWLQCTEICCENPCVCTHDIHCFKWAGTQQYGVPAIITFSLQRTFFFFFNGILGLEPTVPACSFSFLHFGYLKLKHKMIRGFFSLPSGTVNLACRTSFRNVKEAANTLPT